MKDVGAGWHRGRPHHTQPELGPAATTTGPTARDRHAVQSRPDAHREELYHAHACLLPTPPPERAVSPHPSRHRWGPLGGRKCVGRGPVSPARPPTATTMVTS